MSAGKLERTPSVSSQELNWKPPPRDHPVLRRMQSFSMQSYKPKIISETRRMIEDLCRDLVSPTFWGNGRFICQKLEITNILQTKLHSILEITLPDFYTLCHATKIKIYCHIKLLVMMIILTPFVSSFETFLTVTQKNKLPWFCDPPPTRYLEADKIPLFWSNFRNFIRYNSQTTSICRVSWSRDFKSQINSSCISKKKIVNNDHIHVVEQRLRVAINEGLDKDRHEKASVKCYPVRG